MILDVESADPRKSKWRYNHRLTIARVSREAIPKDAVTVQWIWDRTFKRRRGGRDLLSTP